MKTVVAIAGLVFGAGALAAQTPCAKASAGGTAFYLEPAAPARGDSLVIARLCLTSARTLGSFMAVLTYDSTAMRVVRVETTGGMQASNAAVAGTIRLAGATPSGFANGPLATIVFKSATRRLRPVSLTVPEANTVSGASLRSALRVDGWLAK